MEPPPTAIASVIFETWRLCVCVCVCVCVRERERERMFCPGFYWRSQFRCYHCWLWQVHYAVFQKPCSVVFRPSNPPAVPLPFQRFSQALSLTLCPLHLSLSLSLSLSVTHTYTHTLLH